MSEEWRRIAECRRPVSTLRLSVTADAEIEIRSRGVVVDSISLSAGSSWRNTSVIPLPWLRDSFSVWLRSNDPNCQCQIQAEYIEEVTTPLLALDMRFLYGPMGLGIPMAVTGNPLDYRMVPARPSVPYEVVRERLREPLIDAERSKEQVKEEKPSAGVTRLQAFKRELEEETEPKEEKKHSILSRLKRKRGENNK